ncbi:MAG: tRNA pseudouridine(38-40) synthase TruA [Steroidobacteraceae bacterium]|nr:tRNA pseudouridine(38-40) synthase TruA [Steroidobacteraceae bacterium]
MRLAIGIEYDGTAYAGWQSQTSARGVQSEVERALGVVADHPVALVCAGRTDAGVHAACQVAHFDTTAQRRMRGWVFGANTNLPNDVALLWAVPVAPDFHARYSARARSYRYVILNREVRPAIERKRVCWIHDPLDAPLMHEAAQALVGRHDFSSFRASECQSPTPVRVVESLTVRREGDRVIIEVTANAFLHHMVRNIAGTLITVGRGERPAGWVAEALAARDRKAAGITAPAGGLYLTAVRYPEACGLPAVVPQPASAIMPGA